MACCHVQDIAIWYEQLGKSADEIASEYGLTVADVHAARADYFDHRENIDAWPRIMAVPKHCVARSRSKGSRGRNAR